MPTLHDSPVLTLNYRPMLEFEDRTAFLAEFRSALDCLRPDAPSVLVFHGMGGIGKSAFRRKIEQVFGKSENPAAIGVLEFSEVRGSLPAETLAELRDDLQKRNKDMSFPAFDLGYSCYQAKTRPGLAATPRGTIKEAGSILGDAFTLAPAFAAVVFGTQISIAGAGIFIRGAAWLAQQIHDQGEPGLCFARERLFAEGNNPSKTQIRQLLPELLSHDLRTFIERHPERKVV